MKAMTPEEFDKTDNVKGVWKYNYTKLPPTIVKIHREHFCMVAKVFMWLSKIGCKPPFVYSPKKGIKHLREQLMSRTNFEIEIRHDNDYIEMGPGVDDPYGHRFHIITPLHVNVTFKPEDILSVTQQLELFSEKKLPINIQLDKVYLNFYIYNRKLKSDALNFSATYGIKLAYDLDFEVKHTWGSMYND